MALISCPECSHQVSELAPMCPNCGFPITAVTPEGVIALRNCPECRGTGICTEPCPYCDRGKIPCGYCRRGYIYDDICKYCRGTCQVICESCQGKGTESWDCQTCNSSGQVALREYEELIVQHRNAEEAEERERLSRQIEHDRKDQEEQQRKLVLLQERLTAVKDDLMPLRLAQGMLIITDSVFDVDRAKIMKTYTDQLQELKIHRFQCSYCGEPLQWKERLRRLRAHANQECTEGWERVSKQIAENTARYNEFMRQNAPTPGEGD